MEENKPFDKRDYPIYLLNEAEWLFDNIKSDCELSPNIVKLSKPHPLQMLVEDRDDSSDFIFHIREVSVLGKSQSVMFTFTVYPQSADKMKSAGLYCDRAKTFKYYKDWSRLVSQYHSVNLTSDQAILLKYEEEFYTQFEIVDEDAETEPFDLPKQLLIDALYEKTIEVLEKNPEENEELIKEAKEIKEDIPNMTKKTTVRKTSKFLAKLRKKGLKLLQEVLTELKGELIKRGVGSFLDNLPDWWTHLLG